MEFNNWINKALLFAKNDDFGKEGIRHNLVNYFNIHMSKNICNRINVQFCPRDDYWWCHERKLLVFYLNQFFRRKHVKPNLMRKSIYKLASELTNLRKEGLFDHFPERAEDFNENKNNLSELKEILVSKLEKLDWHTEDTDFLEPLKLGNYSDLREHFIDFVKEEVGYEDEQESTFDVPLAKRIRLFPYLSSDSYENLDDHFLYWAAWYEMLTSTNAYDHGGAQALGPVLGNEKAQDLLGFMNEWSKGKTIEEVPFMSLGSSDFEKVNRSHMTPVSELYGFCSLDKHIFINKAVLSEYQKLRPDITESIYELSEAISSDISEFIKQTITKDPMLFFDEYMEEAQSLVGLDLKLEYLNGKRFNKEFPDAHSEFIDNFCELEFKKEFKIVLDSLQDDQKYKIMLHLASDVYARYLNGDFEASESSVKKKDQNKKDRTDRIKVGFYLSKFELLGKRFGKKIKWKTAFKLFYGSLKEDDEELSQFSNSVKNYRDLYDAYHDNGRVGWRDQNDSSKPYPMDDVRKSVFDAMKKLSEEECFKHIKEFIKYEDIETENMENIVETGKIGKIPLNQILYGPPGTGKTYTAVYEALRVIDGKEFIGSRLEAIERFKTYESKGYIRMVTFHQSYSYEDFIEGIRPITNKETKQIEYKIVPGLLKSFVGHSLFETLSVGQEISSARKKYIIEKVNEDIIVLNPQDDRPIIGIPTELISQIVKVVENGTLTLEDVVSQKNKDVKDYINYDKFILGYRAEINAIVSAIFEKPEINAQSSKNKVLIIDEINRGNISKIFGELITLVEETKRSGEQDGVPVKLQYSGESFILPRNLYFIGTMNTADRSIAVMDIALRRRFKFKEVMPDLDMVVKKVGKVDFCSIFESLNSKISVLLGRDYQVGHSYFMSDRIDNLEDLKDAWFDNLIPLLNEYFHEEWDKLKLLLGPFIESSKVKGLSGINLPDDQVHRFLSRDEVDERFESFLLDLLPKDKDDKKQAA
jgi:5-methylcytosine-specific restriction endonuclease McrBC GTP-binding regulatory subunit McrB